MWPARSAISLIIALTIGVVKAEEPQNGDESQLPENFHTLSKRISSSGEPVDEKAFAAIARTGVKTIVSVDGARPDAAAAHRQGLSYIHLPIGYDGVPKPTIAALAKLLQESAGGVLIHCHHGKHRGPAAAAIACMIEGSMSKEQALTTLEKAGTSPDYTGLWRDVRAFDGVAKDVMPPSLQSAAEVEPLVADMVAIDHAFDAISYLILRADTNHTGRESEGERWQEKSTLLVEGFREALRHLPVSVNDRSELESKMNAGLKTAEKLRAAAATGTNPDLRDLVTALKNDCRACHRKFRD